jgi:hypothetical protein
MLIFHTKLSVRPGIAAAQRDQFRQAVMEGRDFNTNTEYIILNHESQQFSNVQRTGVIGKRRAKGGKSRLRCK